MRTETPIPEKNTSQPVWIKQFRKANGQWQQDYDQTCFSQPSAGTKYMHSTKLPFQKKQERILSNPARLQIPRSKLLYHVHNYLIQTPLRVLSDLFLPRDYPHSVHPGYLEYQLYDSLQGLCSYVRGTLSTSAILTLAGVGDAEATSWGAAMQWALKDGMGMMGGLVFSYATSLHFDSHVKEFRLFADCINDVGLFLDMVGPTLVAQTRQKDKSYNRLVLILSSVATLCRVMCGMAAGATKGSITQHFSKHNLADLNSKEGTQETLVSLTGMILGIFLARYLQQVDRMHGPVLVQILSWWIFAILTIIHIWANYRAVSILRLRTLNQLRAEHALEPLVHVCSLAVQDFLDPSKSHDDLWTSFLCAVQQKQQLLRSPNEVQEPFLKNMFQNGSIHIGSTLKKTLNYIPSSKLYHDLSHDFCHEQYLVIVGHGWKSKHIMIQLRLGATEDDTLKALTHALIIRSFMDRIDERPEIVLYTHRLVRLLFEKRVLALSVLTGLGWDSKLYFPSQTTCRLDWGQESKED